MPRFTLAAGLEVHYEVDDFTDPWRTSEAILMLHGNCESSRAWYGWVPHLARHYRLIRPDMHGFGASTPVPSDFPWTLDRVIADFVNLMESLGIERFHLAGAKIGGVIGRAFAARRPDRLQTLTIVGSPPPIRADQHTQADRIREVEEQGIEHWARRSMAARLGKSFPPEGVEWWIQYMARTPVSSEVSFLKTLNFSDITADVPRIQCPTLVIHTEGSGLASVADTQAWVDKIPNSTLVVLPGDSFHVAATHADASAQAMLEFLRKNGSSAA